MNIAGVGSSSHAYSLHTRSASSADQSDLAKKMASRMLEEMDADSDGSLSAGEIGVSSSLLSKADSDSDGKLSESELINLMGSMGPPPMSGMNQSEGAGGPPDPSQMFSKQDSNSDGALSKEEFLAGRPDDVSQAMAEEMWSKLDSEGTGSLSQSQFSQAMASMGPPPGPPPGGGQGQGDATSSSTSSQTSASSATDTTSTSKSLSDLLAMLLENYGKSRYQQSLSSNLASLLGGGDQSASGISVTA